MQAFAKLLGQSQSSQTMADGAAAAAAATSPTPPPPGLAASTAVTGGSGGGNASAVALPSGSAKFDPSAAAARGEKAPQPRVEPIAHLPTVLASGATLAGSLLDVTPSYIVYSVKNGLVRVLDRNDGTKTLLRGHDVKVGDTAFFASNTAGEIVSGSAAQGADVLATVGGSGDKASVLVWRLFRGDKFSGSGELGSEKLLEVRHKNTKKLVWHPFDPNKFVLLHGPSKEVTANNRAVATLVETTRLVTVPHSASGHAVCLCGGGEPNAQSASDDGIGGTAIDGAVQLIVPSSSTGSGGGGEISVMANDIVYSPSSARHVLTAHDDGCVRLWDTGSRVFLDAAAAADGGEKEVSAALLSTVIVGRPTQAGGGKGVVNSCRFLPGYADARPPSASSSSADDTSSYLTPPFITGSANNTILTLWSPFTTTGSPPVPIRTFHLDVDSDSSRTLPLIMGVGTIPPSAGGDTHVFLADSEAGRLFVVHLSSTVGTNGTKVAAGFDYVVPFDTVHPIYSMKCTAASGGTDDDNDNDDVARGLSLYCVQSKAIQVLTFTSKMLTGPAGAGAATGVGVTMMRDAVSGTGPTAMVTDEEDAAAEALVAEFEDYDDEEEEEEEHVPDDFEDYEDEDDINAESEEDEEGVAAPAASSLPPPGLQPGGADPFANWLGALAAGKAGGTPAPAFEAQPPSRSASSPLPPGPGSSPPPSGLVPPGITSTQSEGRRATSPPPPPGAVPPTPAPTPLVVPKPSPPAGLVQQALLNPMELLSSSSLEKEDNAAAPPVEEPKKEKKADAKKEKKQQQQKQEKRAKSNKKGKASGGAGPPADAPGKIAILKRDETPVHSNASQEIHVTAPAAPITTHAALVEDVRIAVRTELLSAGLAGPAAKKEQPSPAVLADAVTKSVTKSLEKSLADPVKKSIEKLVAADKKKQDGSADAARAEKMASAVAEGVKGPVVEAFHGAMKDVMIPAYEAATRQMFSQVSSAIAQGMAQQQQQMAQVQAQASSGPDEATLRVIRNMSAQMENMARTIEGLRGEVANLHAASQAGAGPGMGGPPGMVHLQQPQVDPGQLVREEIVALLSQREYETAFTKALSASNKEVAVFACKNANIQDVLEGNTGPALSQPILLCLMQQLGAVLSASSGSDLRTELAWLQDIAVTLDPTDVSISRHVGGVLKQLVTNINAKMAEGDPALNRPLRMLLQVIRGIGGA